MLLGCTLQGFSRRCQHQQRRMGELEVLMKRRMLEGVSAVGRFVLPGRLLVEVVEQL